MSFTLKMSGVIVGRSELENRDPTGTRATGAFRPGLGYELVQPVFDLYESAGSSTEALSRYRRSRDALHLELMDSSGNAVAVRELHIRRDASSGAPVLEVEANDPIFRNHSSAT